MNRLLGMLNTVFAVVVMTARTETDDGKGVFEKRCSGCHSLDRDKEGPRLAGRSGQGRCGDRHGLPCGERPSSGVRSSRT